MNNYPDTLRDGRSDLGIMLDEYKKIVPELEALRQLVMSLQRRIDKLETDKASERSHD